MRTKRPSPSPVGQRARGEGDGQRQTDARIVQIDVEQLDDPPHAVLHRVVVDVEQRGPPPRRCRCRGRSPTSGTARPNRSGRPRSADRSDRSPARPAASGRPRAGCVRGGARRGAPGAARSPRRWPATPGRCGGWRRGRPRRGRPCRWRRARRTGPPTASAARHRCARAASSPTWSTPVVGTIATASTPRDHASEPAGSAAAAALATSASGSSRAALASTTACGTVKSQPNKPRPLRQLVRGRGCCRSPPPRAAAPASGGPARCWPAPGRCACPRRSRPDGSVDAGRASVRCRRRRAGARVRCPRR